MAVLTYKGGKYRNLAGNKIFDGNSWHEMTADSKIYLDGKWYNFGWEKKEFAENVVMLDYPGFSIPETQEPTGTKFYVAPVGSGDKSGTSWDNATDDISYACAMAKNQDGCVYCMEGLYDLAGENVILNSVNLYGGFVKGDGTWGGRDGIKHPSVLRNIHIAMVNELNGFLIENADFLGSSFIKYCVIISSEIEKGHCENCTFWDCYSIFMSYGVGNAVFNSEIRNTYSQNSIFVNCSSTDFSNHNVSQTTVVNSSINAEYLFTSGVNCLSWNNEGYVEAAQTGDFCDSKSGYITLGFDNNLTRFRNVGYFPAKGIQKLGGCPSPFVSLQAFADYVNSFGDWRPDKSSVLAGSCPTDSNYSNDIFGVVRTSGKYTFGALEPYTEN